MKRQNLVSRNVILVITLVFVAAAMDTYAQTVNKEDYTETFKDFKVTVESTYTSYRDSESKLKLKDCKTRLKITNISDGDIPHWIIESEIIEPRDFSTKGLNWRKKTRQVNDIISRGERYTHSWNVCRVKRSSLEVRAN